VVKVEKKNPTPLIAPDDGRVPKKPPVFQGEPLEPRQGSKGRGTPRLGNEKKRERINGCRGLLFCCLFCIIERTHKKEGNGKEIAGSGRSRHPSCTAAESAGKK